MDSKMNKIHNIDCLEFMRGVPDNYFDLIIADPPYFEVKGDFDFIWKTFDDFLEWVELLAIEFKRILSDKGSLYLYGHAKKIAYKQIIFDKYFNLENHIVWGKSDCQTKRGIEGFRSFAPVKEHILFYSKEIGMTGLQIINNDQELYKPIRDYFKEQRELINESLSTINRTAFGDTSGKDGMAGNILSPYKKGWGFPTREKYEKLQAIYNICLMPYEDLRKEYEDLRRPFNNTVYTDVLSFSQEVNVTGKYAHPTQKPPKLSRALISTSTRQDSKVYIPFIGSGVEAEQCKSLGLDWCGTEIDINYVKIANKRLEQVQGSLF